MACHCVTLSAHLCEGMLPFRLRVRGALTKIWLGQTTHRLRLGQSTMYVTTASVFRFVSLVQNPLRKDPFDRDF